MLASVTSSRKICLMCRCGVRGEEKKRREGGEGGGREEGGEKKEERGKEGRGGRWEVHVQWSRKWKGRRERGMRGRRRAGEGKRMVDEE